MLRGLRTLRVGSDIRSTSWFRQPALSRRASSRAVPTAAPQIVYSPAVAAYLATLNDEQLRAAICTDSAVRVMAGPGSGKTRVVAARVAHLLEHGHKCLVITFTNKAAKELQERITSTLGGFPKNEISSGTFHSICGRILRKYVDLLEVGLKRDFLVYDQDDADALKKNILKDMLPIELVRALEKKKGAALDDEDYDVQVAKNAVKQHMSVLSDYSNIMSQVTSKMATIFDPPGGLQQAILIHCKTVGLNKAAKIAKFWELYEDAKAAANVIDFDGLLSLTVALLQRHPQVVEKLRRRWSHVLVDEFQDTNAAQYELVRLLVGSRNNMRGNVFVVGDPNQAIYGWRGANSANMSDSFIKDWPRSQTMHLLCNYRSRPHILESADEVLQHIPLPDDHQPLRCMQAPGGAQVSLSVREVETEALQAASVAQLVAELHQTHDIPFSEVAILYRKNLQARLLEPQLLRRGIAYRILGSMAFWNHSEVKACLAYISLAANLTGDTASLDRILKTSSRGLGASTVEKLWKQADARGVVLPAVLFGDLSDVWLGRDGAHSAMQQALQPDANPALCLPKGVMADLPPDVKLGTKKAAAGLTSLRGLLVLLRNAARYLDLDDVVRIASTASGLEDYVRAGRMNMQKDNKEEADERLGNLKELMVIAQDPDGWKDLLSDLELGVDDTDGAPQDGGNSSDNSSGSSSSEESESSVSNTSADRTMALASGGSSSSSSSARVSFRSASSTDSSAGVVSSSSGNGTPSFSGTSNTRSSAGGVSTSSSPAASLKSITPHSSSSNSTNGNSANSTYNSNTSSTSSAPAALLQLATRPALAVGEMAAAGGGGGEGDATMSQLLDFLTFAKVLREKSGAGSEVTEAVTLSTLHKAKGLEWRAVIMVGCVDGNMPIFKEEQEAEDEEVRLAYVGMTRAKDHLYMYHYRMSAEFGRREPTIAHKVSPFLEGFLP